MDIGHENGASKSSETGLEESDGNGTGEHSLRQPELIVGNGNRRDSSDGTGTIGVETGSKLLEAYPGGGIESDPFDLNPDVSDATESSKGVSTGRLRLSPSSSSSSSSSGSSMDDQFQDDTKLSEPRSGIASTSYAEPDDEHHVSGGSTSKSQVPSHMHDESTPTQSPPIQVMDRVLEGFDPYRIPSSVFDRSKSSNSADWSTASNDSLFSIQIGSTSFFKDELFTLSTSPVASAADPDRTSFEFDNISDYTVKDKTDPSAEEPTGERPTHHMTFWNSPSTSRHSDETETSRQSFAFPVNIYKKKGARPSCYYSSRPLCYCRNRSIKRWHRHSCSVLEGGRDFVSTEENGDQRQQNQPHHEQQQQQQQQREQEPLESVVPSKSSSCFDNYSFFSCCQQKWQCCNWRWHWRWRGACHRFCQGKRH